MGGALETATRKLFDALDRKDAEAIIHAAAKDVQSVDERWTDDRSHPHGDAHDHGVRRICQLAAGAELDRGAWGCRTDDQSRREQGEHGDGYQQGNPDAIGLERDRYKTT